MDVSKFIISNETINVKDNTARNSITAINGDITKLKSDVVTLNESVSNINNYAISYNSNNETISINKK